MIKNFKKYLASLGVALALALPAFVPVVVSAQGNNDPSVPSATSDIRNNFCEGVDISVNADGSCDVASAEDDVNNTVKLAINLFSAIVGIISVVMIIVGGIRYITSGGDSGNVTAAKNTILYAVIGLIVVALAQVIVRFVLARFTGSS